MTVPLLEARDLSTHFPVRRGLFRRESKAVRAVDGVSLTLAPGETLGLVGESGCGKSTLVKTLLFLEQPTGGEIRFGGEAVTAADAGRLRRQAQIVFQDPYTSLPPRMRVAEIIADPLRIHRLAGRAAAERRALALMREVGLNPARGHDYPFQFSGGQRQRISIARALAIEPSLLLLDEAVSALDVSVQAQVLNLLRDLQERRGLAYIFISHDLGVIRYMSDRIAVMYLGKIVEHGPAATLYERPLHPYSRALVSAVPSLRRRGERIRLAGEPPNPTAPPSGCAFHPRCPLAQPVCAERTPALQEWRPGRFAACHFALQPLPATGSPTIGPE
ncbi:MAG: ATP-binding cassette domain-containing protein, partial [Chloroflexota bacterium]|nr:ATP-binding cassette domain-containing protein [Chloroflexota bacterium]